MNILKALDKIAAFFLLAVLLVGSVQVYSQCGQGASGAWELQNRRRTTSLSDLHVFDKDSAVFVGAKGTVIRTEDGGSSWDTSFCTGGDTSGFKHVHFVNDTLGWTVGENGTILHTQDGGVSWSIQNSSVSSTLLGVYFVDSSKGWAVGKNNTTLRTTDGGQNWTFHGASQGGGTRLASVKFKNDSVGWCVGSSVYYTENGGQSWMERDSGIDRGLHSLDITMDSTLWAAGNEGYFATSTNGGGLWEDTTLATLSFSAPFRSVDIVDSSKGWMAGSEGIFHSADGGHSWSQQSTEPELTAVRFSDSTNGWGVGKGGRIFRTTDGGNTWDPKYDGGYSALQAVHFENDSMGWAVGLRGNVIRTTDSGSSWQFQKKLELAEVWNDIHFTDTSHGWVLADGHLFNTTDGGTTWNNPLFGGWDFYNELYFVNADTGWIFGGAYDSPNDPCILLHSEDGGSTWSQQDCPDVRLYGGHFVNGSEGWAVGSDGTILHTDNGGSDWTSQSSGTNKSISSVHFVNGSMGWVVGGQGTILHTDDGGNTWSQQNSGTSVKLNSVYFPSPDTGWAVGADGTILHTRNGGQTWGEQENPSFGYLTSVHFADNSTGWAVGDDQMIVHTSNSGGSTGIHDLVGPNRDGIKVFPNPVRNKVQVRFPERVPDELYLSLWDPLGRLVKGRSFSSSSSSSHPVMDLSGLDEGVYILRVRSEGKNYTRKLIKREDP